MFPTLFSSFCVCGIKNYGTTRYRLSMRASTPHIVHLHHAPMELACSLHAWDCFLVAPIFSLPLSVQHLCTNTSVLHRHGTCEHHADCSPLCCPSFPLPSASAGFGGSRYARRFLMVNCPSASTLKAPDPVMGSPHALQMSCNCSGPVLYPGGPKSMLLPSVSAQCVERNVSA